MQSCNTLTLSQSRNTAGAVSECASKPFFFFQAEGGIRDVHVTGVQTCALPIFAENLRIVRIDRNDPVAVLLHVLRGEIARPMPLRRQSDDGDRASARENAAQPRDVVDLRA